MKQDMVTYCCNRPANDFYQTFVCHLCEGVYFIFYAHASRQKFIVHYMVYMTCYINYTIPP